MWKHTPGKCVNWGLLALRVAVGVVFIYHGWTKLIGMEGVVGMMVSIGLPVPLFWAWLVALVEFVGGIALILGLCTRTVAVLLAIDMVVALLAVHTKMPYKAAELPIMLLGATIALYTTGAGKFALMGRKSGDCMCDGACGANAKDGCCGGDGGHEHEREEKDEV